MKHLFNFLFLDLVIFQDNYIKYRCRPSGKFQMLCKSELRTVFHFGFALSCVCAYVYVHVQVHIYEHVCMYECTCVCMSVHVWCWEEPMALHMEHVLYQGTISLATA